MKKITLFSLALLITFCLGSSLQAEEVQKRKASSKVCMYVKRALGIGFGACAFSALMAESLCFGGTDDVIDANNSVVGKVLAHTLWMVTLGSIKLKDQLDKKRVVAREVFPVALAAVFGLVSYKLFASCGCPKEEVAAEEVTA